MTDATPDETLPHLATIDARWQTLINEQRPAFDDVARTIAASGEHGSAEELLGLLQDAPDLSMDGADSALRIISPLGEGGMGIVQLAEQRALARNVAVKTLRLERQGEPMTLELLREAWVTGWLEHPNIAPVYMLGRDQRGSPVLVMKRISGQTLSQRLEDDAARPDPEHNHGLLEQHLRALIQVSNAVHYAHCRGIIHRDIKPSNIIMGEFGEVYLLDWGLAAGLTEVTARRLPDARALTQIAGTPAYMAPEMVEPGRGAISPKTDVYLLGATLHHILTGQPPHHRKTPLQTLYAASLSEPCSYPPEVPQELVMVAHRAMAAAPEARFEDAQRFRQALEDFLHHRSASELCDEALALLEQIDGMIADDAAAEEIDRVFTQCHYGLVRSLKMWPDNDLASAGLQRLLETMIAHELAQEHTRAARRMIQDLPTPNPQLVAQLEAIEARVGQSREDMRALREATDVAVGASWRSKFIFTLAGLFATYSTVLGALVARGDVTLSTSGVVRSGWMFFIFCTICIVFGLKRLKGGVNRKILTSIFVCSAFIVILRHEMLHFGLTPEPMVVMSSLVFAMFSFDVAITTDRRIGVLAVAFLVGNLIAVRWPSLGFLNMGIAGFIGFIYVGMIWRGLGRDDQA